MDRRFKLPIAKYAWKLALPLLGVGALLLLTPLKWAVVLCWAGAGSVLFFFRDPDRAIPVVPDAVLSPADGKVLSVQRVPFDGFPNGEAQRVSIFMSLLNVHITRSPWASKITSITHHSGKFFSALSDHASDRNENMLVHFQRGSEMIAVKHIAGAVARRIICHRRVGDSVDMGERVGMICFGSRVDVWLPVSTALKAYPGMHVRGGQTIIGIMPAHEQERKERNPQ
jgi:phosphatidylserine decarboxylase